MSALILLSKPAKLHKQLLADFQGSLDLLVSEASDTNSPARVKQCAKSLHETLQSQAQLMDTRKGLNASIGRCKAQGESIDHLLEQVKALSHDLNTLKTSIAQQTDDLVKHVQSSSETDNPEALPEDSQSPCAPGHFIEHKALSDVQVDDVTIQLDISRQAWDTYVDNHPCATHYHQFAWQDALRDNFRHAIFHIAAISSAGDVVGVLPVLHLQSRVVEPRMLSMPFVIYGGALADSDAIADLMANYATDLAKQHQCNLTEIRETRQRKNWRCNDDKVSMILRLPPERGVLEKALGSKLMAQVRRAVREEPTVTFGGVELVDEFYEVFSRKMRDHGTPVYRKRFFVKICELFKESTELAVVRLHGKVVAAAFTVKYRNTCEVPWAASLRESDRLGMNMFLYHSLLGRAIDQHYCFFDFGRSSQGASTYRFKKQWGAKPFSLYWNSRTIASDESEDSQEQSKKLQLAIALWKRMPVSVTRIVGPPISGELPW